MNELAGVRGALNLPVERGLHFSPTKTIRAYAEEATSLGRIAAYQAAAPLSLSPDDRLALFLDRVQRI